MKSFYKAMAGFAVLLLVLGVLLAGVAVAGGAREQLEKTPLSLGDYFEINRVWENRTDHQSDSGKIELPQPSAAPAASATADSVPGDYAVRKLDFELGAGEFELRTGEEFTVTTASGSMQGITAKMDGDTWKIQTNDSAWRGQGLVTITVPADFAAQALDIELGAGQLTMRDITAKNVEISVGAGAAGMTGCALTDADFECAMGEIVYHGQLAGRGNIECGMGNVEIYLSGADTFGYSVDCGVGNVDVFGYSYSGLGAEAVQDGGADTFYAIDCGMGNVSIARR